MFRIPTRVPEPFKYTRDYGCQLCGQPECTKTGPPASAGIIAASLQAEKEVRTVLQTLLLVVLVLLLIGMLPAWPYSTNWGYYPSGGFAVVLIIMLVFLFSRPRTL